jgi:hypothetical protein
MGVDRTLSFEEMAETQVEEIPTTETKEAVATETDKKEDK